MDIGKVERLYSGSVQELEFADGSTMLSAIRKSPAESLLLECSGLIGDQSSEAAHHTPDKTVHFFNNGYYPVMEKLLGISLSPPIFGENFSTSGFSDDEIYVGDHLTIGDAIVCVTQPTERCKTIGKSLGQPKILKVLHDLEICGFYARVVQPGNLWRGSPVQLTKRVQSDWSITRLHKFMFNSLSDDELMDEVQTVAPLSTEWKQRALAMLERKKSGKPLSSSLAEL